MILLCDLKHCKSSVFLNYEPNVFFLKIVVYSRDYNQICYVLCIILLARILVRLSFLKNFTINIKNIKYKRNINVTKQFLKIIF